MSKYPLKIAIQASSQDRGRIASFLAKKYGGVVFYPGNEEYNRQFLINTNEQVIIVPLSTFSQRSFFNYCGFHIIKSSKKDLKKLSNIIFNLSPKKSQEEEEKDFTLNWCWYKPVKGKNEE